jgi:hypothetical protein
VVGLSKSTKILSRGSQSLVGIEPGKMDSSKKFSKGPELINLLSGKTSQKGSLKIVIELYPL